MHCPFCFAVDTKVIDSRLVGEGSSVRRRRQCLVCNERFTTFEVAEDRKSTRLNSSHPNPSRMPSSA